MQNLNGKPVSDFFKELKSKVNQHYGVWQLWMS
jgi:hypothetical protein